MDTELPGSLCACVCFAHSYSAADITPCSAPPVSSDNHTLLLKYALQLALTPLLRHLQSKLASLKTGLAAQWIHITEVNRQSGSD